MDFKFVTEKLLTAFQKENVSYSLIGSFALGLWGSGRATVDVDFLINRDDMDKVDIIMKQLGYECKHKSENVSQYISPLKVMGEVDFLHAFRTASIEMIGRSEEKDIFNGALKIKVLQPEDLIGLKLQALNNDPSRESTDMADIESLLLLQKDRLDWQIIEEYFKLFNMGNLFGQLRAKYK